MQCEKCGTEYKVLRDQDDNPIRRLCPCEVLQPCHQCKRGRVNHAQLTRTGEVAAYACAKHGSPDAADWPPPGADKPSAGRVAAEAIVEGKLKAAGKAAPKGSELVKPPAPPKSIHGRLKSSVPLHEARCAKCRRMLLTTLPASFCPGCGAPMVYEPIKGPATTSSVPGGTAEIDGVYSDTGPRGTSLIITGMILREEPYDVCDVYVAIPRE